MYPLTKLKVNTMTKSEALAKIHDMSSNGAWAQLAARVGKDKTSGYWIVLGQFEVSETQNKQEVWTPLAIHMSAGFHLSASDGRAQSNGGARFMLPSGSFSDGGNAHQGQDGIWLWDID